MNIPRLILFVLGLSFVTHTDMRTVHTQNDQQKPCSAPEYHQFDFWIGQWDTFEVNDLKKVIAHNRVESMLGGCAIREVYEQNDGLIGESFSVYDSTRGVWHQSWVTNRGQLLTLEGGLADGEWS